MGKKAEMRDLFRKAKAAALEAGSGANPVAMIVQDADVITGGPVPGGKAYFVPDGVCGFASVVVKPGTSSFARYLVKNELARKNYYGGVAVSIREFNQSLARKEAAAEAMAKVFSEAGIRAYVDSRMD